MESFKKQLIIFVCLISIFACEQDELIESNFNKVIEKEAFQEQLSKNKRLMLIDVRTEEEFSKGTIEGASHFDLLNGDFEAYAQSADTNLIHLVFCAKGSRSEKAAKILKEKGIKKVYDLEGGFTAWVE